MLEPPTDEALVAAYAAGDEAAFRELFARHRDGVLGYAWRMLRRHEEAEEVCVEVFTRLVEGRYRPTGSLKAFLFTVAHRLCLDRLRRRGRWGRVLTLLRGAATGADHASPEGRAIQDERVAQLEQAIGDLPEKHRSAVLLFYGQDLSSRQVAEILDMTDQQLRSVLSYARRRLRAELATEEVSS